MSIQTDTIRDGCLSYDERLHAPHTVLVNEDGDTFSHYGVKGGQGREASELETPAVKLCGWFGGFLRFLLGVK